MARFEKFEDIEAWKKARVLTKEIYSLSGQGKCSNDFSFKRQITSAAFSIMSNISEGNDRDGNKEFINFLSYARGSAAEVRSLLYVALDQEYIKEDVFKKNYDTSMEISKMLKSLMRYLRNSEKKGFKFR